MKSSSIEGQVELSKQLGRAKEIMETTEARGGYQSKSEMRSILGAEVRSLDRIQVNEAMLHCVEKTLTDAPDTGFSTSSTGVNQAFFQFV